MSIKQLATISLLLGLSTSAFAADSKAALTQAVIDFDKNRDKVLDQKEMTDIKSKKPNAHAALVNYCKLLKAKPADFAVKAGEMKASDGKVKPAWVCNDKRVASAALARWIEKNNPSGKAGSGTASSGAKGGTTRADAVKAIDGNSDQLLDHPEAQRLLTKYPKMHAGLMNFCTDVKAAPVKYGLKPADVRKVDGKPTPGWACNNKRVGKAALSKWISSGVKP